MYHKRNNAGTGWFSRTLSFRNTLMPEISSLRQIVGTGMLRSSAGVGVDMRAHHNSTMALSMLDYFRQQINDKAINPPLKSTNLGISLDCIHKFRLRVDRYASVTGCLCETHFRFHAISYGRTNQLSTPTSSLLSPAATAGDDSHRPLRETPLLLPVTPSWGPNAAQSGMYLDGRGTRDDAIFLVLIPPWPSHTWPFTTDPLTSSAMSV